MKSSTNAALAAATIMTSMHNEFVCIPGNQENKPKNKSNIKTAEDIAALNKAAERRLKRNQKRLKNTFKGVGRSKSAEQF